MEHLQENSVSLEQRVCGGEDDQEVENVLLFGELRCIYCHDEFYKEPDTRVSVLENVAGSYLHQDCGKQSQLPVNELNATYAWLVNALREEYAKNKSISPKDMYALVKKKFTPRSPKEPLDVMGLDAARVTARYASRIGYFASSVERTVVSLIPLAGTCIGSFIGYELPGSIEDRIICVLGGGIIGFYVGVFVRDLGP